MPDDLPPSTEPAASTDMAAPRLPDESARGARDARAPRRLPRLGMPESREQRRTGTIASLLFHAALLALVLTPLGTALRTEIAEREQGAGGPGPAGGGGGGNRGTGGARVERVTFASVKPPPPPALSTAVEQPPVVVPPKPTPVVPPPPRPAPAVTPPSSTTPAPTGPVAAPVPGTGGGTGSDGSGGTGPGSGGGVGSGVGTGRGSGTGPGTGGGTQENYPPQPLELYLPPEPRPARVKGTRVVAEFDVDEQGKVLSMRFTETPDGGYNRKLREMLKSITRFRPGTRPDGTPVRMVAQISFDL